MCLILQKLGVVQIRSEVVDERTSEVDQRQDVILYYRVLGWMGVKERTFGWCFPLYLVGVVNYELPAGVHQSFPWEDSVIAQGSISLTI